MDMVIDQMKQSSAVPQGGVDSSIPDVFSRLIERNINLLITGYPVLLDVTAPLKEAHFASANGSESGVACIINQHQLNDMRYMNKFLESINRNLPQGGYLIGCVEASASRKKRILGLFPKPLNTVWYVFDYLISRVWPKLPYLRSVYFALTKGKNRVISEMEAYGRLYSCGFRLVDSEETDGKLYFVAEKTGEPDYNTEATYGPFIKLRRVGKNGKIVKVYKMRTMYPYSEYVQEFIYERNGAGGIGTGSKFNNDPRITTVGRFMRKYWIDELPMLYNLLRGDLKLFGVRPISKHYFSLYPEEFREFRKDFKPGLVPPVYVEIPKTLEDTVEIERRYLQAYQRQPLLTDVKYFFKALYNIFIKRVRSC